MAMLLEALRNFLGLIVHAVAMAWDTALTFLAWLFAHTTSATWAAVAAIFAALSSFLTFSVQRRNLLESVRPELVLLNWDRKKMTVAPGVTDEVILFRTLRNVGRGAAFHININCGHETADDRPTAAMSTLRHPILGAGESTSVEGRISVWFKNANPRGGRGKSLAMTIEILCWDSRNIRHETRYNLYAIELSPAGLGNEIAPGVALTSRVTRAIPVWRLRLRARLARVPALGRLFGRGKLP